MKFEQKYFLIASAVKYDYINELLFFNAIPTDSETQPTAELIHLSFISPPKVRKLIKENDWIRVINFYKEVEPEKKQSIGYKIEVYNYDTDQWIFIHEEILKSK